MMVVVKRFLMGVALVLLTASVASARMVSINGGKVNMRSGPGTGYAIIWELGKGFPLKVIDSKGGWLKVADFENDVGWIHGQLAGRVPHLVVKKKGVNIRSGPGTGYRVVGKARYGVVFRTLERRNGWVKVKHEDGLTGWVERSLLWGW
jgi:SH3-like domain-containing protein